MVETTIRPIREHELAAAMRIGLIAQRNQDVADSLDPSFVSSVVSYAFETGTMMAAVTDDDTMIGYGASLQRGGTRFLSQLFVLPNQQSASAGRRLLEAVMPPGPEPGATISSNDPRAVALYLRAGMLPRWPHFDLAGNADSLRNLPDTGITVVQGSGYDEEIVAWDAEIGGRRRPEEHRYLLEHRGGIPLWFERDGQRIGYGYANVLSSSDNASLFGDTISLGPLGCRAEADALACALAADQRTVRPAPGAQAAGRRPDADGRPSDLHGLRPRPLRRPAPLHPDGWGIFLGPVSRIVGGEPCVRPFWQAATNGRTQGSPLLLM